MLPGTFTKPLLTCLMTIVLSGVVGACSSGNDFDRPSAGTLKLGQATVADVVARFGQPASRTVKIGDAAPYDGPDTPNRPIGLRPATVSGEILSLHYSHFESNVLGTLLIGPLVPTVTTSRSLILTFWNGRLISYSFDSNFDKDTSDFNESKAQGFIRGQTTMSEVIGRLGMPGGEGIFPRVANEGTRVLVYRYSRPILSYSSGYSSQSKSIEFLFDSSDRLIESYATTSSRIR